MKRALAAVLGAGLLLAGCGQSTPTATSTSGAYADGLDHSWTASIAEGQRLYAALSQGLKSQDFNIGLSVTATSGYGPIELNTSNGEFAGGDGHPITLNGQVFPTGLGVHANSEIHIHATNLETPACTRFQADVGVDDEVGTNGSVVFQVFADGVKLFDSGVMTGASATQHVDVGIGNKSDLRFVVTDAGNNSFYDHADWAGASLSCTAAPPTSVTLSSPELSVYHLHHADLQATFGGNYKGPVDLRLDDDAPSYIPSNQYSGITLQTKQVILDGTGSSVPITFAAPNLPFRDLGAELSYLKNQYRLVASVNGTEVARTSVNIEEKLLNIQSRFEPSAVSGTYGGTAPTTLVVSFDPPLEGDYQTQQKISGLDTSGRDGCALLSFGTQTFSPAETRVAVTVQFNEVTRGGQSCTAGGYMGMGGYIYKRYGYYSGASSVTLGVTYAPLQF